MKLSVDKKSDSKKQVCGFVAIVGLPNSGKSTLMNRYLKEKVSIVSPKPQTTRSNVTTILSSENYQVIFIDTPPKVNNPKYKELGIEPVESYLRDKIGIVVSPEKLDTVPEVISNLMLNGSAYKKDIVELRKKYVYAFGHSAEIGAQYIKGLI